MRSILLPCSCIVTFSCSWYYDAGHEDNEHARKLLVKKLPAGCTLNAETRRSNPVLISLDLTSKVTFFVPALVCAHNALRTPDPMLVHHFIDSLMDFIPRFCALDRVLYVVLRLHTSSTRDLGVLA